MDKPLNIKQVVQEQNELQEIVSVIILLMENDSEIYSTLATKSYKHY